MFSVSKAGNPDGWSWYSRAGALIDLNRRRDSKIGSPPPPIPPPPLPPPYSSSSSLHSWHSSHFGFLRIFLRWCTSHYHHYSWVPTSHQPPLILRSGSTRRPSHLGLFLEGSRDPPAITITAPDPRAPVRPPLIASYGSLRGSRSCVRAINGKSNKAKERIFDWRIGCSDEKAVKSIWDGRQRWGSYLYTEATAILGCSDTLSLFVSSSSLC